MEWSAATNAWQKIPVIQYADTEIILNGETLTAKKVRQTAIGTIRIQPKIGTNTLTLRYPKPPLFNTSLFLSVLTLFILFVKFCKRRWR